ncbi:MAG: amino acid adenylation domain-containing protein, partial [Acidobacteria bacterium]|nr:amino acid adenylation domain-containing protein [Acidobacteriota bacterium]
GRDRTLAAAAAPITPVSRDRDLPLSFAQQRLWFIEQLQAGTAAYNIPSGVRLSGPLHAGLFERALGRTAARHDTMRTTFGLEGGRPVQKVAAQIDARLPLVDLSGLAHDVAEAVSQGLVDRCARTPFDLANQAPWRAMMLRLAPEEHVFLTVMHHIISDTWTTGVYFREMVGHYKALADGGEAKVPELPIQYGDYAAWQRSLLEDGGLLESQLTYWVDRFAGAPPLISLPTDRPRPAVQTFRGGRVTLVLPNSLTDRLKALTAEEDATFFMTLMASYQALLHRYTGDTDILVGTPMANRNRTELENLIGLFVNTLVLRTDFRGRPTFRGLLQQVRETTLQGLSHHDVPFERVVEALSLERDTSRNPLFQVLFAFQNVPIPKLVAEGLTLERYEFRETTARLEVELDLQEMPYGFVGWLGYNSDLFEAATAERMAKNFRVLLEAIASDADVEVARLELMAPEEREQVLWGSNRTAGDFPRQATLVSLFEDSVDAAPGALAIEDAGGRWTYADLEARANRLAALLVGLGVRRGLAVGLHLERGGDMAAAALAVMKAGGFYVPLHPSFPPERVATILATAEARVLIAHTRFWNELEAAGGGELLDLDAVIVPDLEGAGGESAGLRILAAAEVEAASPARVDRGVEPGDIAYAIFTSGSTGTPKGVVERHEPVVNILTWVNESFDVGPEDRLLWVTALSFDLSVYDLFGIFAAGGSVRTASEAEVKDPGRLLNVLATEPITFWDSAPAALQQLVPMLPEKPLAKAKLRLVLLSGDWIPVSLPDQVRAVFPGARMISLGGATEATIWSNCFPIGEVPEWWPSIPYGKAIRNARYHVLDAGLEPQPINVAGDLYIAGECLSSGYMGSPALTASKFLPDPWGQEAGGRMYRTGDRARYWGDGNIEFLGRLDAQVKVRGYRIELGEIAAALASHDTVCDAAVIVREDTPGDQRLVAYVVPEEGAEVAGGVLRPYLQQKLPDYMVPSRYVALDSLPVTANGKLDRDGLPAPEGDRPELEQVYVDPESEVEQTIAGLWQGVLGVDRVGRHDNFFELGGHSMLLTQIHVELAQKYPELTLVDLFTYPTVASLAEHLGRAAGAAAEVEEHFERALARRREGARETDVAIIGMALRYPKAVTPEEFWANLTAGLECIEFFTLEEVLEAGVDPQLAHHPDYVRAEGTVAEVDKFDWRFFGYGTKEEVELLDPQQRIFMECCWEVFERAGYNPYDSGAVTGVFGGVNISSYLFNALYDYDPYNVMSSFLTRIGLLVGNQNDYLCTRIAYHFDLKGPAFTVQTACSTATVATHLACQSLARGECDMALAGGVQIRVPQNMGYLYQEGGFPSPDGHCRSFDARARGNVHGNGAGVLLLKRVSDAVRDGDRIHAVIKGSALANDGSVKVGFTAPGVSGQARAAAEALAVAGVGADDIGYLEATGTATELGDPIEIEALSKAYTLTTERRGFLPIGSVKSNIGHLEPAAGIAGLIKAVLA